MVLFICKRSEDGGERGAVASVRNGLGDRFASFSSVLSSPSFLSSASLISWKCSILIYYYIYIILIWEFASLPLDWSFVVSSSTCRRCFSLLPPMRIQSISGQRCDAVTQSMLSLVSRPLQARFGPAMVPCNTLLSTCARANYVNIIRLIFECVDTKAQSYSKFPYQNIGSKQDGSVTQTWFADTPRYNLSFWSHS